MRLSYLAQDRVALPESVKLMAWKMAKPTNYVMKSLKRLGRYLKGKKTCVLEYKRQIAKDGKLLVYTDSDWAGDEGSRNNTSGTHAYEALTCCVTESH